MQTVIFNRKSNKVVALILAAVILLGSLVINMTVPVLSVDVEKEKPIVLLDGEVVRDVTLEDDAKLRFEAVCESEASSYQWQIKDPASDNRWINIADGYSKYLWVTHALVGSMLDSSSTAKLRCRVLTETDELFTDPVGVTVSLNVTSAIFNSKPTASSTLNEPEDDEETELITYSIVINYLFDNNTMAFEPYGATVAAGSDFITGDKPIKSPDVVGYAPFRRIGDDYVDATFIEFNLTNIRENITINVIYEPILVNYQVQHHLQNILDDEYVIDHDLTTTEKALTGSIVGDGLGLNETEFPGFKALAYEKLVVAADGSTVIEIRYDRNYYLIDFDMNGGYGTEPVYTRYGATIGANTPIRHGYVFDGWELISYGGQAPTTEQQSKYDINNGKTIEVPAANLRYKARWITQQTTYTMVFWRENAEDTGYSYWGYLDNLPAMSGSYVSGQDYISRVSGIEDEQYFTFNELRTDKNVLVEGDGSTVVNVYYTRNYYTITFKATAKCGIETGHQHLDSCYDYICGKGHVHTETCVPQLECVTEEHTAHTASCIICGKEEHVHGSIGCDCDKQEHTHAVNCWNNIGSVQSKPNRAPSNPQDGQIYRSGIRYYIYLKGSWYTYNGRGVSSGDIVDPACKLTNHTHGTDCSCNKQEHTHTDSCYRDTLHTHTAICYKYSCGETEHIHSEACKRLNCGIPENHAHNSTCTNSGRSNTIKLVYAKYEESLTDIWPVVDGNGNRYDQGQRWEPGSSSYFNAVLVYIEQMPPDDFTLTLSAGTTSHKNFTMQYYLQVLPGEKYDVEYNKKQYKLYTTVKAKYNYLTKAEDFFDIYGFTQSASSPAFGSNNQIQPTTSSGENVVKFYYDRKTDNIVEFNNNGIVLDDKTVHNTMYGAPLKNLNFEPDYPDNLEPNAYSFKGWYISPGCFDGTEVDWESITMPAGDLMLYAKWAPVTHTLRVFKDATLTEQIGSSQIVDHKAFASAPEGNITNGNYVFQGWFYKDEVNGVMVEKAFSFNGIPVLEDMDIYAKWSSHVPVKYTIKYMLDGTNIEIADPTEGNAIAGNNKTFDAKSGDQLYKDYQIGYYPITNSHTITMSVDGDHEFIFYYVFVESMPYKVQYIDQSTGRKLCDDKIVTDNALSVVTETFKRFDQMMPDAYQKRLVLSADKTDADNDNIYDANVITFYYNSDEEHAYYRVVHYIQNIVGDTYREYRSEETVGIIGNSYTVNALTLTGFEFNPSKTKINEKLTPSEGMTVTTSLSADGALIELYYDRQSFNYTVKYIDSRTDKELYPEKIGTGVFGEQVIEKAENLHFLGYELVSDSTKSHTISANVEHNIIEFHYQEMTVALKYQIVGPAGCGVLTHDSENVTAISGVPNGSAPLINKGFIFVGWYKNADCTEPVDSSWVDASNKLTPQKQFNVWQATTFYAKFVALETDLTITTKSTFPSDSNQTFIFNIKGKAGTDTENINLFVTVVGNDSVTVTKLPTGDYTITELTGWSWRYENGTAERNVTLEYNGGSNEMIFDNIRTNGSWLDGNDVKNNTFN